MSNDNVLSTLVARLAGSRDMVTATLMFYDQFFGDERIYKELIDPLQSIAEEWTKEACAMFEAESGQKPNPRFIMEGFYRHLLILLLARIMTGNGGNPDELIVFCMAALQNSPPAQEAPDTRH